MAKLTGVEDLKNWQSYRSYVKDRFKELSDKEVPVFVAREKFDFEIGKGPWTGYPVLVGVKSQAAVMNLKKGKVLFREGVGQKEGNKLYVEGIAEGLLKSANKTILKLGLSYRVVGGPSPAKVRKQAFDKLKAEVLPAVKRTLAKKPANEEKIKQVLAVADKADRAGDHEAGIKALKALPAELKAAAEQKDAGGGAAGKAADPKQEAVFQKLQKELLPRVKKVVADKPANRAKILKLVEQASQRGKDGDFAAGIATLRQIPAELEAAQQQQQDADAQQQQEEQQAQDSADAQSGADEEVAEAEEDDDDDANFELRDWKAYQKFMRVQLKKLSSEPAPFFITRKRFAFDTGGGEWKGFAFLVGRRARARMMALKKDGFNSIEGECSRIGRELMVRGVPASFVKAADKTMTRLRLGLTVKAVGPPVPEPSGDEPVEQVEDTSQAEAAWKKARADVYPKLKEIIAAGGDQSEEILTLAGRADKAEKAKDFAGAAAIYEELAPLVEAALAGGDEDTSLERVRNWKSYIKLMRQRIKQLPPEGGPLWVGRKPFDFDQDGSTWQGMPVLVGARSRPFFMKIKQSGINCIEARCTYRDGNLVAEGVPDGFIKAANRTMKRLRIGILLKSGTIAAGPEAGAEEFDARYEALQPRVLAATKDGSPRAEDIRKVNTFARGQADADKLDSAMKALDKLEELLAAEGGGIGTEGVVAYRKSLLAFETARKKVDTDLSAVQAAIMKDLPEEAALARNLAGKIRELNTSLGNVVDEAMNKAKDERAPVDGDIKKRITAYKARLQNDPLVKHVDANPFVKTNVRQTLTAALTEIENAMPTA